MSESQNRFYHERLWPVAGARPVVWRAEKRGRSGKNKEVAKRPESCLQAARTCRPDDPTERNRSWRRLRRLLGVGGKQANHIVVHDVDKEHEEEDQAHLNEALLESQAKVAATDSFEREK